MQLILLLSTHPQKSHKQLFYPTINILLTLLKYRLIILYTSISFPEAYKTLKPGIEYNSIFMTLAKYRVFINIILSYRNDRVKEVESNAFLVLTTIDVSGKVLI